MDLCLIIFAALFLLYIILSLVAWKNVDSKTGKVNSYVNVVE